MAEKAWKATHGENTSELVHRTMQTKHRSDEYGNILLMHDSPMAVGFAACLNGPPGQQIVAAGALSATMTRATEHAAIRTRSDNVHTMAKNELGKRLGEKAAKKMDSLPYDGEGLSLARKYLREADPRYTVLTSDPRFNTEPLANKEAKKYAEEMTSDPRFSSGSQEATKRAYKMAIYNEDWAYASQNPLGANESAVLRRRK